MQDMAWVDNTTDWVVVRASGADAVKFLQGQLTQDVEHLPEHGLTLAGWCTAKGRLLASMWLWRDGDKVLFLLPKDVVDSVVKRLRMFVLRQKCLLTVLDGWRVVASSPAALEGLAIGNSPRPGTWLPLVREGNDVGAASPDEHGYRLALGADGSVACYADVLPSADSVCESVQGNDGSLAAALIQAGIPTIVATTQDRYVPQAINLDLIGGVSFSKGCYPGQEVVARSHYLGKQKRRMARFDLDVDAIEGSMTPGTDVWLDGDTAEPAGTVVNAARLGSTWLLLVEFAPSLAWQNAEAGAESLRLSVDGPMLKTAVTPYALTFGKRAA